MPTGNSAWAQHVEPGARVEAERSGKLPDAKNGTGQRTRVVQTRQGGSIAQLAEPGDNAHLPFGTGHSRLTEVVQYMKGERWQIPANIEHVEKTVDRVAAVKANYDWMVKELNR